MIELLAVGIAVFALSALASLHMRTVRARAEAWGDAARQLGLAPGSARADVLGGARFAGELDGFRVEVEALRDWNPSIRAAGPKAGTKLRICTDRKVIVEWKETRVSVQKGDTVLRIARAHEMSIENVAAANGIHPDRIRLGQELVVFDPVWE